MARSHCAQQQTRLDGEVIVDRLWRLLGTARLLLRDIKARRQPHAVACEGERRLALALVLPLKQDAALELLRLEARRRPA